MNRILRSAAVFSLFLAPALPFAVLAGCKTDQPGVTNTLGTYATDVNVGPEKATKAAEKALDSMKFLSVMASRTSIDGRVTAKTAQNDDIVVNIEKIGDNRSHVRVRVGGAGDAAVSAQILDKIRHTLE